MSITERAQLLVSLMNQGGKDRYTGEWLKEKSPLTVDQINEAVDYLENTGKIDLERDAIPQSLFNFSGVRVL